MVEDRRSRYSKFRKHVLAASLAAVVYGVWHARNLSYWQHAIPSIASSIAQQKCIVRNRVKLVMPKKVSRKDFFLVLYVVCKCGGGVL